MADVLDASTPQSVRRAARGYRSAAEGDALARANGVRTKEALRRDAGPPRKTRKPASVNAARGAYAIGELLEFGLVGNDVFVTLRFLDAIRRARVEMQGEVGGLRFHDVDPLDVARCARWLRPCSSNRHATLLNPSTSVVNHREHVPERSRKWRHAGNRCRESPTTGVPVCR